MKKSTIPDVARVALIWNVQTLRAQRMLYGLHRKAQAHENVILRRFPYDDLDTTGTLAHAVKEWKPDAIMVRTGYFSGLNNLRSLLPRVPLISATTLPAGIADAIIGGTAGERIRLACEHFKQNGIRSLAMINTIEEVKAFIPDFLREAPKGQVFSANYTIQNVTLDPPKIPQDLQKFLLSLPKPSGLLTINNQVGLYLFRVCEKLGLIVPFDMQIIGTDDLDDCLACHPHITGVGTSAEQVGETMLDAALGHVLSKQRLPSIIPLKGCQLIPRGSTGPVSPLLLHVKASMDRIQSESTTRLSAKKLLEDLPRQSSSVFYRHFQRISGTTPARLIRQRRLAHACRLLRHTRMSVRDIAKECGFSSISAFCQIFKKNLLITPLKYRKGIVFSKPRRA